MQTRLRTRAAARGPGSRPGDLRKQLRALPSRRPDGPRLPAAAVHTRYADDHLLGFIGPKAEAEEIKARLAEFLRETLGLELNQDKTLITHARTQRGAVPRLRHHRPALRHEDHQRPQVGQREDRAAGAAGRDQGPVRPLPAARQTVAPVPAPEPGRLRHRPDLRSRIPGRRQLLPARPGRLAADTGCAGTPRRRC